MIMVCAKMDEKFKVWMNSATEEPNIASSSQEEEFTSSLTEEDISISTDDNYSRFLTSISHKNLARPAMPVSSYSSGHPRKSDIHEKFPILFPQLDIEDSESEYSDFD
jgi:hypothetical protein